MYIRLSSSTKINLKCKNRFCTATSNQWKWNTNKKNVYFVCVCVCVRAMHASRRRNLIIFDGRKQMISIGADEEQVCAKWSDEPFGIIVFISCFGALPSLAIQIHSPDTEWKWINWISMRSLFWFRFSLSRYFISFSSSFGHSLCRERYTHANCEVYGHAGWKIWKMVNVCDNHCVCMYFFPFRKFDGVTLL